MLPLVQPSRCSVQRWVERQCPESMPCSEETVWVDRSLGIVELGDGMVTIAHPDWMLQGVSLSRFSTPRSRRTVPIPWHPLTTGRQGRVSL